LRPGLNCATGLSQFERIRESISPPARSVDGASHVGTCCQTTKPRDVWRGSSSYRSSELQAREWPEFGWIWGFRVAQKSFGGRNEILTALTHRSLSAGHPTPRDYVSIRTYLYSMANGRNAGGAGVSFTSACYQSSSNRATQKPRQLGNDARGATDTAVSQHSIRPTLLVKRDVRGETRNVSSLHRRISYLGLTVRTVISRKSVTANRCDQTGQQSFRRFPYLSRMRDN
jgi:hypothetical protein